MCVTRRTGACYEHWADADISFLAKGKDRLMSACSMLYGYDSLCFLGGYKPTAPTRHIPFSALKRYPFHGSLRFGWLAAIVEPFLQVFLE